MNEGKRKERRTVIGLQAQNVKRIELIELDQLGQVVEVSGKNGAGKTSLLDCISLALEGRAKSVGEPLRIGEDRGHVTLDLGGLVVTRTWRRGEEDGKVTTSLRVETADGGKLAKPQQILDELVNRVAFDPLRFAGMSGKDRISELLRTAGLTSVLEELDAKRRKHWDERAEFGREARRLEGALAELPRLDSVTDATEEISVSELLDQVTASEARQATLNGMAEEVSRCQRQEEQAAAVVADQTLALDDAQRRVVAIAETLETAKAQQAADAITTEQGKQAWLDESAAQSGADHPSTDSLRERIGKAEETNAAVRALRHRVKIKADADDCRARYDVQTNAIDLVDRDKTAALEGCPLPLPGLGLSDSDVMLRGVPFGDLSASERLGVGVTLALAGDPELRVCLIRDASLLDDDAWGYVVAMAHEHDFQIWLETVGDGRSEAAVIIEDGHVAESVPS